MSDGVAAFNGLVDLASVTLGGRAVGASDEFFAPADNLVQPGRGTFIEGKFTDRGKWMDGWESRRKRQPGHDWCIIELGAPGRVIGLDIDTNHFVGNSPAFASIDGASASRGAPLDHLIDAPWTELLAQAPIRPGSQNLFAAVPAGPVSHLRLSIFPDGGVARLRAYGRVHADWAFREVDAETGPRLSPDWVDLSALRNGGLTVACSDAFFGPMNALIAPGRAETMGDGWETRRRRGPGHDWVIVQLGARGTPCLVEIDTRHFKGNYPDRISIDCIDSSLDGRITDLVTSSAWSTLLPATPLQPDSRHFFGEGLALPARPSTHVRLNAVPDGGVSRLRVWGLRHG